MSGDGLLHEQPRHIGATPYFIGYVDNANMMPMAYPPPLPSSAPTPAPVTGKRKRGVNDEELDGRQNMAMQIPSSGAMMNNNSSSSIINSSPSLSNHMYSPGAKMGKPTMAGSAMSPHMASHLGPVSNSNNSSNLRRPKTVKASASAPQLHSIASATSIPSAPIAVAIKTANSTPSGNSSTNNNPNSSSSTFLASPDNRKRNKLGYHRISVACGHCRRRKIRCLAAPDDTAGRCANCIRLKKECTFLPVDPANIPNHATSSSSSATKKQPKQQDEGIIQTEPPVLGANQNNFAQYPTMARPGEYAVSPTQQHGLNMYPTSQGASENMTVPALPQGYDQRSQIWDPATYQGPAMSSAVPQGMEFNGNGGWKAMEPSMYQAQFGRAYNYVTSGSMTAPNESHVTAPRNDLGWAGPPRTMSLGQNDPKLSHENSPSAQQQQMIPRRSVPLSAGTHRHMSEQSSVTTVSEPTPGPPIGAPGGAPQVQDFGYQQQWAADYGGPGPHQLHEHETRVYDDQQQQQQQQQQQHIYNANWY